MFVFLVVSCTEWERYRARGGAHKGSSYSLLGELAGTLVTAVAEQLNNSALVGGETVSETIRLAYFLSLFIVTSHTRITANRFERGIRQKKKKKKKNSPGNLLHDGPDKGNTLALVTLGARDAGLGADTRSRLL